MQKEEEEEWEEKKGKRTIYKRTACCKVFVEFAKRVKKQRESIHWYSNNIKNMHDIIIWKRKQCIWHLWLQKALLWAGQFMVKRSVYGQQASLWSTRKLTVNCSEMRHFEVVFCFVFCWPSLLSKHFPDHLTWRLLETNICAWTGQEMYISTPITVC